MTATPKNPRTDSQRQKVYDAENSTSFYYPAGRRPVMTLGECQAMVDKILASDYIARKFPDTIDRLRRLGITVLAGRNGGWARNGWQGPEISLGYAGRHEAVVIHEVCHHLAGMANRHHWQFAAAELIVVRHYLGAAAHAELKAAFKAHKVRTAPKATRTLTDEQRANAIANLTAARRGPTTTYRPATFDGYENLTYRCECCTARLEVSKFPTTKVAGQREARCRSCRNEKRTAGDTE